MQNRPTAHGARARWRTWRGCLRGQRRACSTPHRWPRLLFNDTALGRRLQLCDSATVASGFSAPRPARASPRGEPVIRPRSKRALAELAWFSWRPMWGELHPTPLAEALLHRHSARAAAAALKRHNHNDVSCAARPARASPRDGPANCLWSTRARKTWRGCLRGQCGARSTPHRWPRLFFNHTAPGRHSARSAAVALQLRNHDSRLLCRAARACFAPWRTGHRPTEHARAGGVGVVVLAANAGCAPPHTVGRDSSSPKPRLVGGCGFITP